MENNRINSWLQISWLQIQEKTFCQCLLTTLICSSWYNLRLSLKDNFCCYLLLPSNYSTVLYCVFIHETVSLQWPYAIKLELRAFNSPRRWLNDKFSYPKWSSRRKFQCSNTTGLFLEKIIMKEIKRNILIKLTNNPWNLYDTDKLFREGA